MDLKLAIILGVGVIAFLLSIVSTVILYKNKRKYEPDYRTMFILGSLWVLFGLFMKSALFLSIGIPFCLWGILNKDKWARTTKEWKHKLTDREKNIVFVQIVILGVLLILGLVLLIIAK